VSNFESEIKYFTTLIDIFVDDDSFTFSGFYSLSCFLLFFPLFAEFYSSCFSNSSIALVFVILFCSKRNKIFCFNSSASCELLMAWPKRTKSGSWASVGAASSPPTSSSERSLLWTNASNAVLTSSGMFSISCKDARFCSAFTRSLVFLVQFPLQFLFFPLGSGNV